MLAIFKNMPALLQPTENQNLAIFTPPYVRNVGKIWILTRVVCKT